MTGTLALGIDVGGTNTVVALVSRDGEVVSRGTFPTEARRGPVDLVRRIAAGIRRVSGGHARPRAAVVGVAGDIDHDGGVIRTSPNLPGWRSVPLGSRLRRALGMRVTVENDANAAAWGAYRLEAPRGTKNLLCVTLGTGVGGGLVLDGRLFRGGSGSAGEFGHLVIDPSGPPCHCGNRGCVEAFSGSYGLLGLARRLGVTGRAGRFPTTPKELAQLAREGHRKAGLVWKEAGHRLGTGLAGVVNLLNLDRIVLTGGIAGAGRLILNPVRDAVRQLAFEHPAGTVRITLAAHSRILGVAGAGLLAFDRYR